MLIKSGIIDERQLDEALEIQKTTNKRLGEILVELGYLNSRDLIWILSEQASIPFVDLKPEILDSNLIRSFPEKLLYDYCMIPLYEIENKLYVAIGNPTDTEGIEKIKAIANKEVVVSGADPKMILGLLDKFFLVDQTEKILVNRDFAGTLNIQIEQGIASVELIDKDGNITRFEGLSRVSIKIEQLPEEEQT